MDFAHDQRTEELRATLLAFMDEFVYPAEPATEQTPAETRWARPPVLRELQAEARRRGLWNLFLPGEHGAGLTNLQYAPLAEITGRSPRLAPEALNCAAPDTGNMEILALAGDEEQRRRWLAPLLSAEIRSAFAMTEPDVASSDATNIATSITRRGDEWIVTGRKWFVSGAMDPECRLLIVMGRTAEDGPVRERQSMILIPVDTPGVSIRRGMSQFGYADDDHGGHAEITFTDVAVPLGNLLGEPGSGFAIAQARLGPGRIHHCMRLLGMAERAMDLVRDRAASRTAFGGPLADQGVVREWAAESRVRIEQARLLVLKTAWLMDTVGNRAAHTEIQAIKIAVPRAVEWILDKAVQLHGAAGVSQDLPLARFWAIARSLRLADGPDEVHLRSLGRRELSDRAVR
ncbi:acyl-CoA dehydrogenase [Actinoalloteichus hoggarensis]|uniref:(R)-benzylsuccinyl-CoA dehydrogenase n=1 Tax=Actinoalloteichus hoggarensis TaxID=1470176 RepID=A0A221W3E5_9PSEU|nr:acyl-CoA dehydrogenase family protein [Actinoalloteichus hoggarensis]ASO20183.1 (R)-benzylsuccinyl-CoA dehydrogenase [Actinoalloteichus hoggarensis]MBB5919104.1 acyl-CoA dehydrogenase [Actinoalloteichus hoggarensis]